MELESVKEKRVSLNGQPTEDTKSEGGNKEKYDKQQAGSGSRR